MRVVSSFVFSAIGLSLCGQSILSGPMPGYSECLEGIIWLQADRACKASMMYWKESEPGNVRYSAEALAEARNAFAVDLIADQVEPGNTYRYRVLLDGKPVEVADTLRFHTQPLWKFRGDPPDFTLATGSCAYINETAYDRPGKPYGDGYGIFNSIADQHPDLMVWLGDNIYLREPDWGSWSGIMHRYTHTRSTPELQRLLRGTHHYAIWDDHDFGPNDADASFVNADLTRKAFDLFWPNPPCTAPGVGGITTAFSYLDVDVFLLDDRSFRVPPEVVTDTATMLGNAQIDWLIRALKYSDATFKLVALGGQFLNSAAVYETYSMYPRERQRIIDRINKEGLRNVIFITGDRHHTVLSKLDMPNGQPLYDLTVSPFTSGVHAPTEKNTLAVEGTLATERNFAILRFSGPKKERKMTITVRDQQGKSLWERSILAMPRE